MYSQNISIPPDYLTWRTAVPSQSDEEEDWTDRDMKHEEQQTGMLFIDH